MKNLFAYFTYPKGGMVDLNITDEPLSTGTKTEYYVFPAENIIINVKESKQIIHLNKGEDNGKQSAAAE